MDRSEKAVQLNSLVDSFTKAQVAVCVDYRGLPVSKVTALRVELRKVGATGKVVRNTLARIAAQRIAESNGKPGEVEKFLTTMDGPTMVIFSDVDPISPTKVITKFAKENADLFKVKGCWLEGAFVDQAGVGALSTMPGREETFSMLLRLMQEPATRLVRVLSEPAAGVARVIEAYRSKLEGSQPSA